MDISQAQEWLEGKFSSKDEEEIESGRRDEIIGDLVIENYLNLKLIDLSKSSKFKKDGTKIERKIENLTLRNLPLLEQCFIKDWKIENLIIEDCPQITHLEVQDNLLTDLKFLSNLNNLEELNINNNKGIDLTCGLKYLPLDLDNLEFFFEGTKLEKYLVNDWKNERIELIKSIKNDPRLFWDLTFKYNNLKNILSKSSFNQNISNQDSTRQIISVFEEEFKNREEKINELENKIWELTDLGNYNIQKINEFIESFGSEKDLLRKLILEYLKYVKLNNKELKTDDDFDQLEVYEKKYLETRDDLEFNLKTKEDKRSLRKILDDCKSLIERESELENNLNDKSSLIEKQEERQTEKNDLKKQRLIHNIQKRSESFILLEVNLARQEGINEGMLKALSLNNLNSSGEKRETLISKIVDIFNNNKTINYDRKEISKKISEFICVKRVFINARWETIKKLEDCYNGIISEKKHDRVDRAIKVLNPIAEVTNPLALGIPKASLGVFESINNTLKVSFDHKNSKEFKSWLENDENNLNEIDNLARNVNKSLSKLISKEIEYKLFNDNNYKIFGNTFGDWIDNSIRRGKNFVTSDSMEEVILLLIDNLKNLHNDVKQEENMFSIEFKFETNQFSNVEEINYSSIVENKPLPLIPGS